MRNTSRDDREPIPVERPLLTFINPNLLWPLWIHRDWQEIVVCPAWKDTLIYHSGAEMWRVSLTWQQCIRSCSWSWSAGCPACGAGCCSCQVCVRQTLGTALCLQEDDKWNNPGACSNYRDNGSTSIEKDSRPSRICTALICSCDHKMETGKRFFAMAFVCS